MTTTLIRYGLLMLIIVACATISNDLSKIPSTATTVEVPKSLELPTVTNVRKVPHFMVMRGVMPTDYKEAIGYMEKFANTDQFEAYVLTKRVKLSHTDKTFPEAMKMFRDQLDHADIVALEFYTNHLSKSIGGWDGSKIVQNLKYKQDPMARAGHLLHEISHKYGWQHQGNDYSKYDNLNSFPYVIGYAFEDYLKSLKQTNKLAGE